MTEQHNIPADEEFVHQNPMHDGLAKGWVVATSSDGRRYYYHGETGETSWERPETDNSS